MSYKEQILLLGFFFVIPSHLLFGQQVERPAQPLISSDVVFEEVGGMVAVEAEHFCAQEKHDVRGWYLVTADQTPSMEPDGDPAHVGGASGGAYLEILPDTRRTHADRLIAGQNFSNEPGKMAILSYQVYFQNTGRYYVWARTFSTGGEDNGLHVGLDGAWPASGQRMQWTAKQKWYWNSKQRTEKVHTGVRGELYLEIDKPGLHTISFSMREDGFEFDKWLMTNDPDFQRPDGVGPESVVKSGTLPKPFRVVAAVPAVAETPAVSEGPKVKREAAKPQGPPLVLPRHSDGDGTVSISGELKQWHKVTLSLQGPFAHENDNQPNPFIDHCLRVRFTHESGTPSYEVPGYFAADGNAGETGAQAGTVWRAHLSPDKSGTWQYEVSFLTGQGIALQHEVPAERLEPYDKIKGTIEIVPTDKQAPDFRSAGRLQYVGKHHLRFAGSGQYFLKAGADAPETLLAYADFDGTVANKKNVPLKTWQAHVRDWEAGDPTWKDGKGKGLIGALNYLSAKGANAFSFLPYNAGGDGDNVWPFVARNDKLHYDCSKLDQWCVVFDHATTQGLHLHFKLQENEIDDDRRGHEAKPGRVPESLDGGKLGPERMLYCRELIARFAHELALNWNIGEENTQSTSEIRDMVQYLHDVDPYKHAVVIHTFPNQQEKVYRPLLGDGSLLTGVSLQNHWSEVHRLTLQWINESATAGRPWVVANDEQNQASLGVPPDPGYEGHSGTAKDGNRDYSMHDIRKATLWGNLMAGGAGVEYYFGYKLPQNDLLCEDFRSRDKTWDYCRIAIEFFKVHEVPISELSNADALVGNPTHDNSCYCLTQPGQLYLVYLPNGGERQLNLEDAEGTFAVQWFNPRSGGDLANGSVTEVDGGKPVALGTPPSDPTEDWLVVVQRK